MSTTTSVIPLKSVAEKYLDPDALSFVLHFNEYCHLIDDTIDEEKWTPEDLLRVCIKALDVYSMPFYMKYKDILYPIVRVITNMYADSVIMEKSSDELKRQQASFLRHGGNDLWVLCVEICRGRDVARIASMEFRELSFKTHYTKTGEPI